MIERIEMAPEVLAAKVLEMVEIEDRAFDMGNWVHFKSFNKAELLSSDSPVSCDTTLCAAGWACHVAGYDIGPNGSIVGVTGEHVENLATSLLGLGEEGGWLFYESNKKAKIALGILARREKLSSWAVEEEYDRLYGSEED